MKKYRAGSRFERVEDILQERVVWVEPWGRAHPVSFFLSWQLRLVNIWVKQGCIRRAVRIDGTRNVALAKIVTEMQRTVESRIRANGDSTWACDVAKWARQINEAM
jgi:hypothetical protein